MNASDAILVDAHVHFHRCFPRPEFLDAAASNFDRGRQQLGLEPGSVGCLMLTERSGCDVFEELREEAGADTGGPWSFALTGDDNALWATRRPPNEPAAGELDDSPSLLIVAGRQLATVEDLEVLALGHRGELGEGRDLFATLDAVQSTGAVPVVPWGFGKWWFNRGELVQKLLEDEGVDPLFVGDNGGRPALWPRPRHFELAAQRGIWVLPGSDPLPFPGQVGNAGRCGFAVPAPLDRQRPATALFNWLRGCEAQPATFGRFERLPRFVRYQVATQWRKRRAARGSRALAEGDSR